MISERRSVIFAGMCVPEVQFNEGEGNLNMSLLAQTNTHVKHYSFTPDMSSLCFSTEDIPTGPDRTLRTVGRAGTVPASSTGTCV